MAGEWITFDGPGGPIRAFTAKPAGPPPWAALIAIHGASGLDPHHEAVTLDYAAQGYFTVSPDIYTHDAVFRTFALADIEAGMVIGPHAHDIDTYLARFPEARRAAIRAAHNWVENRPGKTYIDIILACYRALKARRDVAAIGAVGFCMGGRLVGELAASGAELAAGVTYYGIDPKHELIPNIRCPLLGHYGVTDTHITERVPAFAEAMKAAGKSFAYHVYEAGHGFANARSLPSRNDAAAKLANERTAQFLAAHLKKAALARA